MMRIQRAQRVAVRKYRGFFEHAVEGAYQSTPSGHYLSVNPALARMYGYASPAEMLSTIGNIAQDVYADADMRRRFQELIERDGEVRDLEYQVRRRDGVTLWICENARVARNSRGEVLYYEGTIQDITRRKQAEAEAARFEHQLFQAKKMEAIGTLASGISHDFNNILVAIIGFTELSIRNLPPESLVVELLNDSLAASLRAKELVNQILTFSRQSAPKRHPIRVGAIILEVLTLLSVSLPANVRARADLASAEDGAVADGAQLHQVLVNLGTNAIHAMREKGGELVVRLEQVAVGAAGVPAIGQLQPGSHLRLSVIDTGHGIPPEALDHLFEPFFTTKPAGEGTGLGLAVVHGIVRAHGGEILVESAVGAGTTFTVYLPQADAPRQPLAG
jgi:PAS domain S-box-containing protein